MDRTIGIEELLGEAGWLRRLAASLVGDGAQAEDLVQDTWVAAMRSPPSAESGPRPWLARVARNLASNRRRDRERREAREGFAHEPRAHDEPGALAQEAEAQRMMAEAVTRLDEPLRDVIVLRYFQGLDSNAVAARLGVPASTVRTRLQRALEALRADLDSRRENWGLLLVPLLRGPAPSAVAIGTLPIWIAGAAAACAVAVVGAGSLASPERSAESAPPAIAVLEEGAATPESAPLSVDARTGGDRETAVVPASPPRPATSPAANEVSGIVRVDGRPPEWPIHLALEPDVPPSSAREGARRERTPRPEVLLQPKELGAFAFHDLAPGWSGRLRVDGYRFADGESTMALASSARGLVLDLRSGPEIVGRVRAPDGLPVSGLGMFELLSGAEGKESNESLMEGFDIRDDGAFRIPILTSADWGIVTIVVEAEGQGYLRHESARFAGATGIDLGVLELEPLRPLEFIVRDQEGAPIPDAFARVEGPSCLKRRPLTGADGQGVLGVVPDRPVDVRFSAFGHRDHVIRAEPGLRLDVVLERLAVLEVQVIGRGSRVRVSVDCSAFVWDAAEEDNPHRQAEMDGARPSRRSTPAAPGQRFQYDFDIPRDRRLRLVGVQPDLALTIETLDRAGQTIEARVVSVGVGARTAIELGKDR